MTIPARSACTRFTEITSLSLGKIIQKQFFLLLLFVCVFFFFFQMCGADRKHLHLKQPVHQKGPHSAKGSFAFHRTPEN